MGIISMPPNDKYRDNFDRIFDKKGGEEGIEGPIVVNPEPENIPSLNVRIVNLEDVEEKS